jgi:hypothetical protein
LVQQGAIAGAEQTVVPDFDKAFGQGVLQETADEFCGGQGQVTPLFGAAVLIPEGDFIMVHLDDAPVAECHPENVGDQIFQGRFATAHMLTMHHPVLVPDTVGHLLIPVSVDPNLVKIHIPKGVTSVEINETTP